VELVVLEAISDVEVSELLGTALVEENETGPLDGSNVDNFVLVSSLDGPLSPREVQLNRLEETGIEGCAGLVELVLVFLGLHVSEMQVALQLEAFASSSG